MGEQRHSQALDQRDAIRNLDALVAEKVMRWEMTQEYGSATWYKRDDGREVFVIDVDYTENPHCFQPSRSIKDAWQVAEKFYIMLTGDTDEGYIATFDLDGVYYWAEAPTAQLAICFAALKAVGYEV